MALSTPSTTFSSQRNAPNPEIKTPPKAGFFLGYEFLKHFFVKGYSALTGGI